MERFDFSGWATRNDLQCSDGRIIRKDAFKHNDGQKVPLVWNHQHSDPNEVLGHALLENRDEGVYAYCTFNETESGKTAKLLVQHGDVSALSIYANQLKQQGSNVIHGAIREVSLVLAGANPGAFIDSIIKHGEESDEEAVIYTGEHISLYHAEEQEEETVEEVNKSEGEETLTHSDENKTVRDVLNTLNEEQKEVVYALLGEALGDDEDESDNNEEDNNMKHNIFENETQENTLVHADIVNNAIADGKRFATLKDSILAHAAENNITDIPFGLWQDHDFEYHRRPGPLHLG